MKKIILLLFIAISSIAFNACSNGNARTTVQKENISFYDVPLVCGADDAIGCGSRAKPALLEMEKNSAVKEAWLNREGTVVAIVWHDMAQTEKVAKPIFDRFEIDFTELKGTDAEKNAETFRRENLWYHGADVDKLSIEEAGHIANTLVNFALDRKLISEKEADKLKNEVENYFKTELVKVRTPEELYNDDAHKFHDDLTAISTNIIGKERTDKITTMYYQHQQEECKKDKSCSKDSTKQCCKKKS